MFPLAKVSPGPAWARLLLHLWVFEGLLVCDGLQCTSCGSILSAVASHDGCTVPPVNGLHNHVCQLACHVKFTLVACSSRVPTLQLVLGDICAEMHIHS